MSRKTYIDNNGFLRYEDNNKIVVKKSYTKQENCITNELYNTFKKHNNRTEHNYPYEYSNFIEGKYINDLE